MKVSELFKQTRISESVSGAADFLDKENCKITNKTKTDDFVLIHLKRESDGKEGQAYLRVQDKFQVVRASLLNWAFTSRSLSGLTLNQLSELETNLDIEKIQDRIQVREI